MKGEFMKTFFALLACVCMASVVSAQTQIPAGQAATVTFAHDGIATDGYRVKVDGTAGPNLPASQRVNGVVTTTIQGQSAGGHSLVACAFNVGGETCTPPVLFTAVASPSAPTNLQIVVTVAVNSDG